MINLDDVDEPATSAPAADTGTFYLFIFYMKFSVPCNIRGLPVPATQFLWFVIMQKTYIIIVFHLFNSDELNLEKPKKKKKEKIVLDDDATTPAAAKIDDLGALFGIH